MSDRDYWERYARNYDASLRLLGRPLPRMLELASNAVRGKSRVLEVAAGTGIVTSAIAQTRLSWLVSRLLAVSGFPGYRRFACSRFEVRCKTTVYTLPVQKDFPA